jgi:BCD family chlorophyll transporter-like MFS transporter
MPHSTPVRAPLSWPAIVRLGLVQSALGAIVMLVTSLLNRVMVVEYAMLAAIPAGLVAFHYVVQLSRPYWGHGSDRGGQRTPWIIGGMGALGLGALLATNAVLLSPVAPLLSVLVAVFAYALIGAGVGASGTSLLALLASSVLPGRRPAAAAVTWIMMIAGIIVAAATAGSLLEPFSPQRLALVAGGVVLGAFLLTLAAVRGVEERALRITTVEDPALDEVPGMAPEPTSFRAALAENLANPATRLFTVFVFVSMVAYSMQDMILEPFAGLVFGFTPGESTKLASVQHMGVLLGMLLVGAGASAFGGGTAARMRSWVVGGCLGSAVALVLLAAAAVTGEGWPLRATVFALGFANGVFAVAAIGAMMSLAGAGRGGREGIRMGLWGASQAIAFACGGFVGAVAADVGRALLGTDGEAFMGVFLAEAGLFVVAAGIALHLGRSLPAERPQPYGREIPA